MTKVTKSEARAFAQTRAEVLALESLANNLRALGVYAAIRYGLTWWQNTRMCHDCVRCVPCPRHTSKLPEHQQERFVRSTL